MASIIVIFTGVVILYIAITGKTHVIVQAWRDLTAAPQSAAPAA